MALALTIAGSDSGGGAGIQADLKTFAAFGVYGTCAVTAVTAQNTTGVTAWAAIDADLVEAQIEAVAGDFTIGAVKTGMLATSAIVEAVSATIAALELPNVVVDPVMIAKGGHRLLEEDAARTLRSELLPRAMIVTPNIPEAEVLAGIPIRSLDDMRHAARAIRRLGPSVVVVKGGHLDGDLSIDVVCAEDEEFELSGPRIRSRHTHGTGCTFSAAITAGLALGRPVAQALREARAFLQGAIEHAPGIGAGHGPLNHFWRLY
ncbi:MAG TPA: bifunctional hydroxymethylpyrimidine kinase/phosphomethylpyrimidine kinase [Vicinamibacterales bacterium]|jgi:hydroxymethylpyrimidine/phosphomethylpyrimidine kinase|nr:bifunctional hydroxymethylpyrimidine kinase/phosphomethylpyrimidine kinase [Vicinamibacterales bacterium]